MTNIFLLDWAILAASIFNCVILIWLGFTVLLNADSRSWAIWLASMSLLMGGLFFVSHTAIYVLGVMSAGRNMAFLWSIGLLPAVLLPLAWYLVMLWYAGFWADNNSLLRRRQFNWLWLVITGTLVGIVAVILGVFLISTPRTTFINLRIFIRWSVAGIPLLALGYSAYVLLCIWLSLDALLNPGPSARMMGSVARRRARPWLIAASLGLFGVASLITAFMVWLIRDVQEISFIALYAQSTVEIAIFDLFVSIIICTVTVLLGRSVVAYEVFTGKSLPRYGLRRLWRRAIILASGFALVIGYSLASHLRSIYALMLTVILVTIFYALFSWWSYQERERYFGELRPFLTSHKLYEQITAGAITPPALDIQAPFQTLCAEVLGAKLGYLLALGPLAPLMGQPLVYGRDILLLHEEAQRELSQFDSPDTMLQSIDPVKYSGAVWAIPLWSERGLIGVFLLGEKEDGGLYSQEEIEIARVSGERLIDTRASAEMAQKLMALQRERLAQTQVIDQRTRRTLHDNILPTLQAAMITLSATVPPDQLEVLSDAHRQISDLLHEMPTTSVPEVARLGLLEALQRAIAEEFAPAFDQVVWQIDDKVSDVLTAIPTLTAEVLFYAAREAVRNSAKYGRGEERPFTLTVAISYQDTLTVVISDNGQGIQTIKTHRSTPQGTGQGLALHSTMMAVIGGALAIESGVNAGTAVTLSLPLVSANIA